MSPSNAKAATCVGADHRSGGTGDPDLLARTLDELTAEFPRFRIVSKADSPLSRAIDLALKAVTLGRQSRFLTHYHTVIGDTLYVPPGWAQTADVHKVITLRHERIHLRQRRRLTTVGMAFCYLIPLLPLFLAYGRARLEWEAYRETFCATAELCGLAAARDPALRRRVVEQFTSAAYGWMWPFPATIHGWIDEALAEAARRVVVAEPPAEERPASGR